MAPRSLLTPAGRAAAWLALVLLAGWAAGAAAQPAAKRRIRFLCLPHLEQPVSQIPGPAEVRRFKRDHPNVENTESELLSNHGLARMVLGQKQLFRDIQAFETRYPANRVTVTFIDPPEWLSRLEAESRVAREPFVAVLGDTWLRHFQNKGIVRTHHRYFNDVRLLWYWKKHVDPADLQTRTGLLRAFRRIKNQGLTPLAISTRRDWDILWNLDFWVGAAGGNLLEDAPGLQEARLSRGSAKRAADFLMTLSEEGFLDPDERSNLDLTRDFLNGRCAMTVMEPWVAWRARRQLGPDWERKIGAVLPPALGDDPVRAVTGGSVLTVIGPPGTQAATLQPEQDWITFLLREENQLRHVEMVQFLPATDTAWRRFEFRRFFDAALGGDCSPQHLATLRSRSSAHRLAAWPARMEVQAVLDELYFFWKRLGTLYEVEPASAPHRRELVREALSNAEAAANQPVRQEQQSRLALTLIAGLSVALLIVTGLYVRSSLRQSAWRKEVELRNQEYLQLEQIRDELAAQRPTPNPP